MAVLPQNQSGGPIASTLVSASWAAQFDAASKGNGRIVLSDGSQACPAELFGAIGWSDNGISIWMTLVIVNYCDKALIQTNQWLNQGLQFGYPTESDLVAAYTTAYQGFNNQPGRPGGSLAANQVPAARPDPLNPSATLYGVAAYKFGQSSWAALYGAEGAMSYSVGEDGPQFFVGFGAPYQSMWYPSLAGGCSLATDLAPYGSDLKTFFNATRPDLGKVQQASSNATVSLTATTALTNMGNVDAWCTVVSVRPK